MRKKHDQLMNWFRQFNQEEAGQDLLEYALVLAAVLAAVVTGSNSIASLIVNGMTTIGNQITTLAS